MNKETPYVQISVKLESGYLNLMRIDCDGCRECVSPKFSGEVGPWAKGKNNGHTMCPIASYSLDFLVKEKIQSGTEAIEVDGESSSKQIRVWGGLDNPCHRDIVIFKMGEAFGAALKKIAKENGTNKR